MAAQKNFAVETSYINEWAGVVGCSLSVPVHVSEQMRRQGFDLCDVHHVLSIGEVIDSDMIDHCGLWVVCGETLDGDVMETTLRVVANEYEVELINIARVRRR